MPHDALVTICGKRWRLRYERTPPGKEADCDPPTAPGKTIRIRPGLKRYPRRLLEALIHESLHAANWSLDEDHVEKVAEDLAALLWKQGFRQEA